MPRDRSTIRRILIRQLLTEREIASQGELARLLSAAGHRVTQSTVSRDLSELGATKADEGTEHERYVLVDQQPSANEGLDELRRALEDYLEGAVPSGNLVVLKVRSATAGAVAAALDAAPPKGVVGTVAGDDTVLVALASKAAAHRVKKRVAQLVSD